MAHIHTPTLFFPTYITVFIFADTVSLSRRLNVYLLSFNSFRRRESFKPNTYLEIFDKIIFFSISLVFCYFFYLKEEEKEEE